MVVSEDFSDLIFFEKENNLVKISTEYETICTECNIRTRGELLFIHKPRFIFIESQNDRIFLEDLPKELSINNQTYIFLSATLILPRHFIGAYEFNKKMYLVDDLDQNMKLFEQDNRVKSAQLNYSTSISFYYLKSI